MARSVKYLVALSDAEVVAAFRGLPEVAKTRAFVVVAMRRSLELARTRKRPPYEDIELAPLSLRVTCNPSARGTLVTARVITQPRWITIAAAAAADVVLMAGGGLIAGVIMIPDIRERRRRERSELLNLVARALGEHELGRTDAPYRR